MNEAEIAAGLAPTPGYRYARRVGAQLFVSGQVPHDARGQLVATGDAHGQCVQCLKNLGTLLAVHGFEPGDIQRLVVYVVGDQPRLAAAWNAVTAWFDGPVPPATLLGVASLGHVGQWVEVDATVLKAAA